MCQFPTRHAAIALAAFLASALLSGCYPSDIQPAGASDQRMILVPAGSFVMGSDTGPPSSRPADHVYLSAYEIGRTEVTNEEFRRYVEESGKLPLVWREGMPNLRPQHPVTGVLWEEAVGFCQWYGWRLPTEAEWEKAARGSDQRSYPWGNVWDPSLANTRESGNGGVIDVGSYPRGQSPHGVLDMAGNVQEWVADYFDPTYYHLRPAVDPRGPLEVLDHGLRGGSWAAAHEHASTFFRDSSHSVRPNDRVGFRCAADASES